MTIVGGEKRGQVQRVREGEKEGESSIIITTFTTMAIIVPPALRAG